MSYYHPASCRRHSSYTIIVVVVYSFFINTNCTDVGCVPGQLDTINHHTGEGGAYTVAADRITSKRPRHSKADDKRGQLDRLKPRTHMLRLCLCNSYAIPDRIRQQIYVHCKNTILLKNLKTLLSMCKPTVPKPLWPRNL